MSKIERITFAVKGSGSSGAGWIGKVESRDSHLKDPITGKPKGIAGVYFGHPQEYSTSDPHMINALRKSGVAVELYREEIDENAAEPAPQAKQATDEHGEVVDLEMMTTLELKMLAKQRGLSLKANQRKDEIVALIREADKHDQEETR